MKQVDGEIGVLSDADGWGADINAGMAGGSFFSITRGVNAAHFSHNVIPAHYPRSE